MRVCTLCHQKVPAGMPVCPRDGAPATDPDARQSSLIGSMVGDYVLKGIIGEGGMGQVFEGLQPVIGKRVAIKLLKREIANDPEEAQRLLTEARAVNAVGHRGIIDIFGFGALPDGRQYFVMEYLSGQPLSRYVREYAPLPVDDALKLVDEMLAAVGAAHSAGVIHRDIKPSNIFLVAQADGSHFVKVLDFGLAKQATMPRGETPQTRVSRVLGTPEYMAPEQARAEAVGPRTDLYALGCVLFEMLTGEPPFDAPTPFEIVNMHLNEPVPPPSTIASGIPAEVDDLVLWLMQKDVADRPESAELVRAEVRRLRKTLKSQSTQLVNQVSSMTAISVQPVLDAPSGEVTRTEPEARVSSGSGRRSGTKLTPLEPDEPSGPAETRILPTPASARRPPPATRVLVGETTESNVSDMTSLAGRRRGLVIAAVAGGFLLLGAVVGFALWPRTPSGGAAPTTTTGEVPKARVEPANTGAANTGAANTGAANTGAANTGAANTGAANTGAANTGTAKTDAANTGSANTGSANTGTANTDAANAGAASTGTAKTGTANTGSPNTGTANTGAANTDAANAGAANAGAANAGAVNTGAANTGPANRNGANTGTANTGTANTGTANSDGANTGTANTGTANAGTTTASATNTSAKPDGADKPKPVKVDALTARYKRARAAWTKTRASRTPEDRRIFDLMIDQIGKQLAAGSRGEAAESLTDFVAGALDGREP